MSDNIIVICKKNYTKYKKDIVLGKSYSCYYCIAAQTYIIYTIEGDAHIGYAHIKEFEQYFITLAEYREQKIIEVLNG